MNGGDSMTIRCPFITCHHNTENPKHGHGKPEEGKCKSEDIKLITPDESEEFEDVDWGKIEPQDLLICATYRRNR